MEDLDNTLQLFDNTFHCICLPKVWCQNVFQRHISTFAFQIAVFLCFPIDMIFSSFSIDTVADAIDHLLFMATESTKETTEGQRDTSDSLGNEVKPSTPSLQMGQQRRTFSSSTSMSKLSRFEDVQPDGLSRNSKGSSLSKSQSDTNLYKYLSAGSKPPWSQYRRSNIHPDSGSVGVRPNEVFKSDSLAPSAPLKVANDTYQTFNLHPDVPPFQFRPSKASEQRLIDQSNHEGSQYRFSSVQSSNPSYRSSINLLRSGDSPLPQNNSPLPPGGNPPAFFSGTQPSFHSAVTTDYQQARRNPVHFTQSVPPHFTNQPHRYPPTFGNRLPPFPGSLAPPNMNFPRPGVDLRGLPPLEEIDKPRQQFMASPISSTYHRFQTAVQQPGNQRNENQFHDDNVTHGRHSSGMSQITFKILISCFRTW